MPDAQDPIAAQLLSGFDTTDESGLASGDQVLFRILLHDGEDRLGEWLLRLTTKELAAHDKEGNAISDVVLWVEDDDGSRRPLLGYGGFAGLSELPIDPDAATDPVLLATVDVEVFDPEGNLLGSRLEHVVHRYLETGFVTACEATAVHDSTKDKAVEVEQSQAHVALVAFLGVIKDHEQLREIFWQTVRVPTLWSLITNMGVSTRVKPEFGRVKPSTTTVDQRTRKAWNMPVQVLGNEAPILLSSLQVVEPHSPRALCAGVVSMVVVRPGDPDTYLTMQLIAARRGC